MGDKVIKRDPTIIQCALWWERERVSVMGRGWGSSIFTDNLKLKDCVYNNKEIWDIANQKIRNLLEQVQNVAKY